MVLRDGFTTNNLGVRAEGFLLTYNMPISLCYVATCCHDAANRGTKYSTTVRLRTLANKRCYYNTLLLQRTVLEYGLRCSTN